MMRSFKLHLLCTERLIFQLNDHDHGLSSCLLNKIKAMKSMKQIS